MPNDNIGDNVVRGPTHWQNIPKAVDGGSGGPLEPGMSERLAKLEGAFEGLKMALEGLRHSQNMMITTVLGVGAILLALGVYTLQRIDALPAEFERLNMTLTSAITASKQNAAPQVIVVPPTAPAKLPKSR
jgi:hypothetical protein